MAIDPRGSPGPVLLVGGAAENWTGDARFHEYSTAADPVGARTIPSVPVRRFPAETHRRVGTGLVPLDLSAELGVPYPASSPALLAAFVVLAPGAALTTTGEGTSELYYCLEGSGRSGFRCAVPGTGPSEGDIAWAAGDFVVLPAGCTIEHRADPGGSALLYRVTDAPLLRYLGATPGEARFAATRYDGRRAAELLAEVERDPDAGRRSRVSILLGNAATPQTLTATHTLWAMLGVLPAGQAQRPHRHQSAAVDLITACRPGCYSLLGTELGADGSIIDPVRVDWEAAGAFVTPPGLWHSHHNESGHPAYLVPVQDAGLHTYLRTLDIRFAPAGA